MTPFASRDRERTKKRKKDLTQGATARDGQSVRSYDDRNDSYATTSGCGCEILQRTLPRSAAPALFRLCLSFPRSRMDDEDILYTGIYRVSLMPKNTTFSLNH